MTHSNYKMLRLALIVSDETASRFGSILRHLLVGLARKGIPICLVGSQRCLSELSEADLVTRISNPGLDLPGIQWFNQRRLLDRLRQFQPNVLHALGEDSADLVGTLAHQLDVPYVLNVNDLDRRDEHFPLSLLRCVGIMAPSFRIYQTLTENHNRLQDRICYAPFALPVDAHPVCYSDTEHQASVVVGHHFNKAQDFHSLLLALKELVRQGYVFLTVLLGRGREESELRRMLAALDLQEKVTIVSDQRPRRSILRAGDLFLRLQTVPYVDSLCQEAMSVGLVVATGRGGSDDFLIEGQTCLQFSENDTLSIRGVLQLLLDQHHMARQLAAAGQSYLRSHTCTDSMVQAYFQRYQSALSWSYGLETLA